MPGRADAPRALALVIPAYRAVASVGDVVTRARRVTPGARCYVVDDGSDDGTAAAARAAGAQVLSHPTNRGKGLALATGIARAVADGAGDPRREGEALPAVGRVAQDLGAGGAGSRRRAVVRSVVHDVAAGARRDAARPGDDVADRRDGPVC